MRCWREMLTDELLARGETWGDVESCTLTDKNLYRLFDAGFGAANGDSFTLWTARRVYFPTEYDGAEAVASVPRNPCAERVEHV